MDLNLSNWIWITLRLGLWSWAQNLCGLNPNCSWGLKPSSIVGVDGGSCERNDAPVRDEGEELCSGQRPEVEVGEVVVGDGKVGERMSGSKMATVDGVVKSEVDGARFRRGIHDSWFAFSHRSWRRKWVSGWLFNRKRDSKVTKVLGLLMLEEEGLAVGFTMWRNDGVGS